MSLSPRSTAIFDLSSTLALVRFSADGEQIVAIDVYPDAVEVLQRLHANGVRVHLIVDFGQVYEEQVRERLLGTDLRDFAGHLLVKPRGANAQEAFETVAALVQRDERFEGGPLLFVGGDPTDREMASRVGFQTAPHALLAIGVLTGGGPLQYLAIRRPDNGDGDEWIDILRTQPVVAIHVEGEPAKGLITVYGISDTRTAAALDELGLQVERLGEPGAPDTTSPFLIRGDLHKETDPLEPGGSGSNLLMRGLAASQLATTSDGIVVALPIDTPIESVHFTDAHDEDARTLAPSMDVLRRPGIVAPRDIPFRDAAHRTPLSQPEKDILIRHFEPDSLKSAVARYVALGSNNGIGSRRFRHRGNKLAVDRLAFELGQIVSDGYVTTRPHFHHEGDPANNVVAIFQASPEMKGKGVVLVCAHLDTINEEATPAAGLAPGGDDDASGMAAVVAAAHASVDLATLKIPHLEMHFALFNCEESGKTGSRAYASALANRSVPVAAMFQMDMIGYNHKEEWIVDAHAGFSTGSVPNASAAANRSIEQAELIEHLATVFTRLNGTRKFISSKDCGASRSDHVNFHAAGYPGCLVSEGLFGDGKPCKVLNPEWHTARDINIDDGYAAEIGRLVAAAAWIAATR